MDSSTIFIKKTENQYNAFMSGGAAAAGDFLSMEEQSALSGFLKAHRHEGVLLYGGYGDSERKQIYFLPEYTGIGSEEELEGYLYGGDPWEIGPVILEIRVSPREPVKPGHRDYLGALMGEGISRAKIGDIILTESGAQIIVSRDLAEYLLNNLTSVGRAAVIGQLLPLSEIDTGEVKTETLHLSVASPRLDNVLSEVFRISRKDAVQAISKGLVYVNGIQMTKPDFKLEGDPMLDRKDGDGEDSGNGGSRGAGARINGDKIVLRGKGKAIYLGAEGLSKKGSVRIRVIRYV